MADRLEQISEGAKTSTGHYEIKRLWDKLMGLFPEKEGPPAEEAVMPRGKLAEGIADFSRMVQSPESTSADWDNIYQDWMDGTIDLEEMSEGQIKSIYDEIRGYEGQEPETMIEELTQFRDRMYSR